jgi:5'-nucleotidase
MKIVVTNDDGIDAPGLASLLEVAERFAEVFVVAPAEEHSAQGHRVTVKAPIRVEQLGRARFRVHGTPADCARLALTHLVPDAAWLLSGINEGGNLGADVYMSGTVAAAREAALLGARAVAVSHYVRRSKPIDWGVAEARTELVLARLLADPPTTGVYWNVNLPHVEGEVDLVETPLDPSGMHMEYRLEGDGYVYGGNYHERPRRPGTDVATCFGGAISLTPLRL